jgi:hypothetical protein
MVSPAGLDSSGDDYIPLGKPWSLRCEFLSDTLVQTALLPCVLASWL